MNEIYTDGRGNILIDQNISIGFSSNKMEIKQFLGKPYKENSGVLVYPDKTINQRDVIFEKPLITFSFYNEALSMIDISREIPLIYKGIVLSNPDIEKTLAELKHLAVERVSFDECTVLFPAIQVFMGCEKGILINLGTYRNDFFEEIKRNEIKYKLKNSKRENGILTYYFDYKDKK